MFKTLAWFSFLVISSPGFGTRVVVASKKNIKKKSFKHSCPLLFLSERIGVILALSPP